MNEGLKTQFLLAPSYYSSNEPISLQKAAAAPKNVFCWTVVGSSVTCGKFG